MQIHYCDDCGTRFEDENEEGSQAVFYCPNCAPKHAPAAPARPSSTRNRVVRNSPARGAAGGSARSPLPRTRTNTPNVESEVIEVPQEIPEEFGSAPESEPEFESEPEMPAWRVWVNQNKPMAFAGAGVVFVVLIVVIWMFMSATGNVAPQKSNPDKSTQIAGKETPPKDASVDKQTPTTPEESKKTETPPTPPPPEPFNAVMDMAKRKLEELKVDMASGKQSSFQLRRRLEWFMGPQLKNTPMQAEAMQLLEKIKVERRTPDNAEGAVPGVKARFATGKAQELFNTDFKATETRTVPTLYYANDLALLKTFGHKTDIAIKFTGYFEIPKDGSYTFYLSSDDGSALYIGDDLVIPYVGQRGTAERDGQIDLKAGKHAFRLEYFQGPGAALLRLDWSGPGTPKQQIPASALSTLP